MIIIARDYGQLGNRLFLYAHLIAAAREYGTAVANPCFAQYAHLFRSTEQDIWCRYPAVECARKPSLRSREWLAKSVYLFTRALNTVGLNRYPANIIRLQGDEACDLGADEFANLAKQSRHLLAQGWLFRSERLLEKHADEIRSHFRILPQHQANVDVAMAEVRDDADIVVGVHIRHGDYKTFLGGKYFFRVDQYAAAMRQVADQFASQFPGQRVAFVVCSNAPISPTDFAGLNVRNGPGDIIEDMYSFAKCDMLIGPPSTYTAWASFYGDVPLCKLETSDQKIDALAMLQNARSAA